MKTGNKTFNMCHVNMTFIQQRTCSANTTTQIWTSGDQLVNIPTCPNLPLNIDTSNLLYLQNVFFSHHITLVISFP